MGNPIKYYAVYDMEDNELCVGVFHGVEAVAKYFNMKTQSVSSDMSRNIRIKRRYEVKKIDMNGGE